MACFSKRGKPPCIFLHANKNISSGYFIGQKEKGGEGGDILRAPGLKPRQTKRKKEFSKKPFAGRGRRRWPAPGSEDAVKTLISTNDDGNQDNIDG